MSEDNPARAVYRCKMQQRQTVLFSTLTATLAVIMVTAMLIRTKVTLLPFEPNFARDEDPNKVVTPCIVDGSKATEVSSTTVNVYNAMSRVGITDEVAKSLKTSGFSVVQIENWGSETAIKESVWIVTDPRGISAVYTTVQYIPESVVHYDPSVNDETTSVALGAGYDKVFEAKDVKNRNPKGKLTVAKGCVQVSNYGK